MIDANKLRGKIAEAGMTQGQVAEAIGMSKQAFSYKIKNSAFGLDDAEKIIEVLDMENPAEVFFPNFFRRKVTY